MPDQPDLLGAIDPAEGESLVGRDLSAVPDTKWAPQLAALVGVLEALYVRQGRPEVEALKLACDGVLAIAEYAGGRVLYLPRGDRLKLAVRDAEMHRRWQRGATIGQLAQDYDLTDIHVYRVVSQQRALHLRRTQGTLFKD